MPAQDVIELGPACQERYFCGDGYPALEALGVPAAGLSDLSGHYRVERCLDRHVVEITLAGRGRGGALAAPGALEAGDVLLLPAGVPFGLYTVPACDWRTAWALLDPATWRRFPRAVTVHRGGEFAALGPLLTLMYQERFGGDAVSAGLRRSLAEAFVGWLRRATDAPTAQHGGAALRALFAEVEARPAEDWSTERLSQRLGCSRSQLHRLCTDAFGRGPAAQVAWVRMQQAQYWLGSTGLPLKVIAERLGFANPYHFSAAFKRHHRCAPASYRSAMTRGGPAARGQ